MGSISWQIEHRELKIEKLKDEVSHFKSLVKCLETEIERINNKERHHLCDHSNCHSASRCDDNRARRIIWSEWRKEIDQRDDTINKYKRRVKDLEYQVDQLENEMTQHSCKDFHPEWVTRIVEYQKQIIKLKTKVIALEKQNEQIAAALRVGNQKLSKIADITMEQ